MRRPYDNYHVAPDASAAWSAPHVLSTGTSVYTGSAWGGVPTERPSPGSEVGLVGDVYAGTGWQVGQQRSTRSASARSAPSYIPITPVRVLDGRTPIGQVGSVVVSARPAHVRGRQHRGHPGRRGGDHRQPHGHRPDRGRLRRLTPTPTANPPSSTLNFPRGDTRANNVTIALAADGSLAGGVQGDRRRAAPTCSWT